VVSEDGGSNGERVVRFERTIDPDDEAFDRPR